MGTLSLRGIGRGEDDDRPLGAGPEEEHVRFHTGITTEGILQMMKMTVGKEPVGPVLEVKVWTRDADCGEPTIKVAF